MSQLNTVGCSNQDESRYKHLYQKEGDIRFIVGRSREEISAHKLVLIEASSTLDRQFSNRPNENTITVENVDPEAFKQMLSFIYRGHCLISESNFVHLFYLGYIYSLRNLLQKCGQWLMEDADLPFVLNVYAARQRVTIPGLNEQCARVIRRKIGAAFACNKFIHLQPHHMQQLVDKIEELTCNYEQLLEMIEHWRKFQAAADQPQCDAILESIETNFAAGRNFGEKHAYQMVALTADRAPDQPYYEGSLRAVARIRVFGVGLYVGPADAFPPSETQPEMQLEVMNIVNESLQIPQRSGVYDLLFTAFNLDRDEGVKLFVSIKADWPPHPARGWYESGHRYSPYNEGEHMRLYSVKWNFLPVAYVLYQLVDDLESESSDDSYEESFDEL